MLFVALGIIIVIGIMIQVFIEKDSSSAFGVGIAMITGIIMGVSLFIWIAVYPESLKQNGNLLASKKNIEIMRITAVKLNSLAVVKNGNNKYIDIANNGQSSNASSAIIAYSYAVIEYNKIIEHRKQYRNFWVTKSFLAPLPKECQELIDINL